MHDESLPDSHDQSEANTEGMIVCATRKDATGQTVRRVYKYDGQYIYDWAGNSYLPDARDYEYGTPIFESIRILSSSQPEDIRAEIEEFGRSHLTSVLEHWGFIEVGTPKKFSTDVSGWPGGVVGYQFDTGGISSGVERKKILRVAGLEDEWTDYTSR